LLSLLSLLLWLRAMRDVRATSGVRVLVVTTAAWRNVVVEDAETDAGVANAVGVVGVEMTGGGGVVEGRVVGFSSLSSESISSSGE